MRLKNTHLLHLVDVMGNSDGEVGLIAATALSPGAVLGLVGHSGCEAFLMLFLEKQDLAYPELWPCRNSMLAESATIEGLDEPTGEYVPLFAPEKWPASLRSVQDVLNDALNP